MKRIISALFLLFSLTVSAQFITPITSFPWANYLGEGFWLNDAGTQGTFASYVTFQGNGWNSVQYLNGSIYLYESVLNIDANGFFTAAVTNSTNISNPISYIGFGSCGNSVCQMSVQLANGILIKSMSFDTVNNQVNEVGAIYYNDGTPNVQWQDNIVYIP